MEEPRSIGHVPISGTDFSCDICMKLKEELKQKTVEVERTTEKFHSFKSCKVCMERDIAMLLLPCMHLCLCKICEPRFNICPVCNTGKVSSVPVFLSQLLIYNSVCVSDPCVEDSKFHLIVQYDSLSNYLEYLYKYIGYLVGSWDSVGCRELGF